MLVRINTLQSTPALPPMPVEMDVYRDVLVRRAITRVELEEVELEGA